MIDRSSWHKLLTFIYAYAGLNQIKMKEEVDEEKITSINEQGSYCFKAISFGLRFMDKNFKDQIGRSMEIYVDEWYDDIYNKVKNRRGTTGKTFKEAFYKIKEANLRLTFGISEGKYNNERRPESNPNLKKSKQ